MFNFIKRHKILSLLVFLNVVAVLVVILIIVIHQSKTATVDIKVAPIEAVIELNGTKYENLESHNITPGDYRVKISMEGMQTKEFEVSLEDEGFVRIWTYLLDADGGFSYYIDHPEDMAILEDVADDEVREFLEEYNEAEALRQKLPINYMTDQANNGFGFINIDIDWGDDEDCQNGAGSCITIYDTTGGNYNMVIDMIRENGINPDDYEIVYRTGLNKESAD